MEDGEETEEDMTWLDDSVDASQSLDGVYVAMRGVMSSRG